MSLPTEIWDKIFRSLDTSSLLRCIRLDVQTRTLAMSLVSRRMATFSITEKARRVSYSPFTLLPTGSKLHDKKYLRWYVGCATSTPPHRLQRTRVKHKIKVRINQKYRTSGERFMLKSKRWGTPFAKTRSFYKLTRIPQSFLDLL